MKTVVGALLLFWVVSAQAAHWLSRVEESTLSFTATYQQQPLDGKFTSFTVELSLDPATGAGDLSVNVDIASLMMDSIELEEGAATPDWFDAEHYPQAEFRSTHLQATDRNHFIASGLLRLKGITQAVEVPFTFTISGDTAVIAGELSLRRTLFNVGEGEWMSGDLVGLGVQVKFEVHMVLMPQSGVVAADLMRIKVPTGCI